MSNESREILRKLEKAKSEVKFLEAEYRAVCECNQKIPGVKFEPQSYQKMYQTCKYHEVSFYHHTGHTERQHHASV
jgi:hypothetical protein